GSDFLAVFPDVTPTPRHYIGKPCKCRPLSKQESLRRQSTCYTKHRRCGEYHLNQPIESLVPPFKKVGRHSNRNYCYRDQDLGQVQAEFIDRRVEYLLTVTHHPEDK